MSQVVPLRHQAEPHCILRLIPVKGGQVGEDLFVPPLVLQSAHGYKIESDGLGFSPRGTKSAVDTAPLEMVLGLKEGVSNLTVDECGIVSTSSQHTGAMFRVQITLAKTQKCNKCRVQKSLLNQF